MKTMKTIHTISLSALLACTFAALSGCAEAVDEETVGTSSAAFSRSEDLAPGIGASACTSDTCVSGPTNDCSGFDTQCKAESGCGVTIAGNPIGQVHTCVTIPPPPPSESTRPGALVIKDAPQEEECFDAATCNQLIADCIGGDHLWTCDSYDRIGRCVRGECHGAP